MLQIPRVEPSPTGLDLIGDWFEYMSSYAAETGQTNRKP